MGNGQIHGQCAHQVTHRVGTVASALRILRVYLNEGLDTADPLVEDEAAGKSGEEFDRSYE